MLVLESVASRDGGGRHELQASQALEGSCNVTLEV